MSQSAGYTPPARDLGRVPDAKPPRQHRSALGRVLYSVFLALSVMALLVFGVVAWGYKTYTAPGPLTAAKVYDIKKGLKAPEMAAELAEQGIIADPQVFTIAASLPGVRGRLKAGEYEFPQAASMRDVMNIIMSGKAILYKVSIPEGWTTWQALERIKANEVLTGDLTLKPAEGAILPDTYLFRRGKTRDELVTDMVAAQTKLLRGLWDAKSANAVIKTPEEAVILASIVEKETGIPDERPRIAAVFGNRLNQKMRLQSDPTIIYGITKGEGKLGRKLTKADIAEETPYNTYRINGLPPGPIANPGKAALEAVLNPLQTKELYFVADGSGGHAFAETLEEHNENVKKWREVESNQGQVAITEGDAAAPLPAAGGDTTAPSAPDAPADDAAAAPEAAVPGEAPGSNTAAAADTAPAADVIEELAPAGAPDPRIPPEKVVEQLKPEVDDAAVQEEEKKAEEAAKAAADAKKAAEEKLAADQKKAEEAKKAEAEKKAAEIAATAEAAKKAEATKEPDAILALKPGTVVKTAAGLAVIPKPKPKAKTN